MAKILMTSKSRPQLLALNFPLVCCTPHSDFSNIPCPELYLPISPLYMFNPPYTNDSSSSGAPPSTKLLISGYSATSV